MKSKITNITAAPAQRRKIVDELGRLQAKARSWKKELDRLAELKKIVAGWAADLDAETETTYDGARYTARVSARQLQREIIAMEKVYEALGQADFLKHCGFTLGKLDLLVPDAIDRGLVKQERTGPRTVEVSPKEPAKLAA